MNSLKDKLYQYRLLVIIVCICLIGGCGYGLYKSFNKKDDSYVTHVKDGDSTVVKTLIRYLSIPSDRSPYHQKS